MFNDDFVQREVFGADSFQNSVLADFCHSCCIGGKSYHNCSDQKSDNDDDKKRKECELLEKNERERIKQEEQEKFWEENEFITFKPEEINKKMYQIVPTRFEKANKGQIDDKIWNLTQPFFNGEGLYLWGKPGTGKTHLCAAIIRDYYFRFPQKRKWWKSTPDDGHKYA